MEPSELFHAVLVGTAVGDSLGLPREGMSRRRGRRVWGGAPLRHQLIFRWGMISDDTEHTCMAAQALLVSHGEPGRFARSLGWRLRWWLIGLPAGIGKATLRGILKLWMGFPPDRSGVFSAGNGPAMRAAILGVYASLANAEATCLRTLVRASTRLTHTDPAAEQGALAIAFAARAVADVPASILSPVEFLNAIREKVDDSVLRLSLACACTHLEKQSSAEQFAAAQGLERGVSGYIYHTVPVALYCWLRWPRDFRSAVEAAILLGGDTDTVGAIVGGLAAISCGIEGIPLEWRNGIVEWPRSLGWMRKLSGRLGDSLKNPAEIGERHVGIFWPAIVVRNIAFLLVVLLHGVRRLLPPYG